jgi:hypothetical protein
VEETGGSGENHRPVMISFFRHFPSYNGSKFHLKFQIHLLTSGTVHVTDFLYYDPAFFYFMEVKLAIFCEVFIILILSWWSVLVVEETGGSGENHRPVASH